MACVAVDSFDVALGSCEICVAPATSSRRGILTERWWLTSTAGYRRGQRWWRTSSLDAFDGGVSVYGEGFLQVGRGVPTVPDQP